MNKRRFFATAFLMISLGVSGVSAAADDVLKRLKVFTNDLTSFTADFQQTLYDAQSKPLRSNKGSVTLKRPGQFIWRYEEDDAQEIVADGLNIWMYDKELEQVTVNSLNDKIGGTPLVLLMGNISLDEEFGIKSLGASDGIDWVELIPKDGSTDFEAMYLGLGAKGLAAMELRDNFGQATQIQFSNFKADVPLKDALFQFQPPAGVDVIGEPLR